MYQVSIIKAILSTVKKTLKLAAVMMMTRWVSSTKTINSNSVGTNGHLLKAVREARLHLTLETDYQNKMISLQTESHSQTLLVTQL